MNQPTFTMFVSSVEDHTVYRFGTKQLIGAKRRHYPPLAPDEHPSSRSVVTRWDTSRVIAITDVEEQRYGAEYRDLLNEQRPGGAGLKRRTEADWKAQCAEDADVEKAARDSAAARAVQSSTTDTP